MGFLGSHLVERLERDGHEMVVARRRDHDLTRYEDTERLFAEASPELVFHLAAEVGGIGANRENPGRYWYANLMMGAHVLELSRVHGVRKLVLAGTVCAPEIHAGAVQRGRSLERIPGGDECAVRCREEGCSGGRPGLPRAVRHRRDLPASGEPLRAAGQFRPQLVSCHPRAHSEDGRIHPARSCSGATEHLPASSSTSTTALRGSCSQPSATTARPRSTSEPASRRRSGSLPRRSLT